MKLKPSLAVLAVALAALAQPALAGFQFTQNEKGEVTHYNGIPLPPIQTVEEAKAQAQKEIAAAQKTREAEQAEPATRHSLPATTPQEVFFTGKPYLEETGQYLFLFRHYDPELARWTTADPSGFPDGANNIAYMAVPTSEFDWQGLWKVRMTTTGNYSPSVYTWNDNVMAGSKQMNAYGSISVSAHPNQLYDSISFSGSAITTRDGVGVQILQSYSVSVDANGNLQLNQSGTARKVENGLGVAIAGQTSGVGSGTLTFNYEVASLYQPSGITGFGVSVPSGAGFSISWTSATSEVHGMLPTIRFEVVE